MNNKSATYNKRIEIIITVVVLAFCELFFFRNVVGNGSLFGDNGDGRLTALLTEHWWSFFRGKETFTELAMFYPCEEVIGYTDLLLGYGIIHSLFRIAGAGIYNAYKLTMITIHIIGTLSMYYLMRYKLNCRPIWSLFGTIAFCYSCTYSNVFAHTQLNAISFLPLLLILFIGFIQHYDNRCKRNIYAYLFLAWFILITYNSWYIACFTGAFCLLLLFVFIMLLWPSRITAIPFIKEKLSIIRKDVVGYIIFTIVLAIPFIKIYLPAMSGGAYSYWDVSVYMPEFADIINVSEKNFLLGWLVNIMRYSERNYSTEVIEGFSIVLLFMFAASYIAKKRYTKNYTDIKPSKTETYKQILVDSLYIAIVLGIASIIRLSSNGISLWWIIYTMVPVVRSMRAVARFWFWLSFPMSVLTAYAANKYLKTNREFSFKLIGSIAAVLLLFVSNINATGVSSSWSISGEKKFIDNVAAPPADAECFYINDVPDNNIISPYYQTDAFDIATNYSIKTINGYSGKEPNGWGEISNVFSENYETDACNWINENDLKHVYIYNMSDNKWIPFEENN